MGYPYPYFCLCSFLVPYCSVSNSKTGRTGAITWTAWIALSLSMALLILWRTRALQGSLFLGVRVQGSVPGIRFRHLRV